MMSCYNTVKCNVKLYFERIIVYFVQVIDCRFLLVQYRQYSKFRCRESHIFLYRIN